MIRKILLDFLYNIYYIYLNCKEKNYKEINI